MSQEYYGSPTQTLTHTNLYGGGAEEKKQSFVVMSFQDVGKPGAPKPPQRTHLTAQPNIPEGRPSSSLPKTSDPFAQLSDGILQYQVKKYC